MYDKVTVLTFLPPVYSLTILLKLLKCFIVGYPLTSYVAHRSFSKVQSTAANPTRSSSENFSAAATNSGFAFLQWPHPVVKKKMRVNSLHYISIFCFFFSHVALISTLATFILLNNFVVSQRRFYSLPELHWTLFINSFSTVSNFEFCFTWVKVASMSSRQMYRTAE